MGTQDERIDVLLAQAGDREALDRLFRSVQDGVFLRVHAIVGQRDSAEDILQDVLVLLWRKLGHLRTPEHFRAWAYRIATREAVRAASKERVRVAAHHDIEAAELTDARARDPLAGIEAAEVGSMIAVLPPGCRSVLVLHYLDEVPLSEVADVLRIPLGTVKSRLSYGLRKLRRRLSEEMSPPSDEEKR